MTIPNLPTDNLYKFLALSGVLLIVLALIMPRFTINRLDEESDKIEAELLILELETDVIANKTEKLKESIDRQKRVLSMYEHSGDTTLSKISIAKLHKDLQDPKHREFLKFLYDYEDKILPVQKLQDEVDSYFVELDKLEYETKKKSGLITIKNKAFARNTENALDYFKLWYFMGISGAILMVVGFMLWYNRVQKVLDAKLLQELKEVRIVKPKTYVSFVNSFRSKKTK